MLSRFHGVADPPTEYPARIPADDHYQACETTCQPDIGDVDVPDLIGFDNRNTMQLNSMSYS